MTIDPSGSRRRILSPVVSSLPSGSQSMEYPIDRLSGSVARMTSAVPSMPTATTCRSIQLQNHRRPSCHRGDSGIPRPLSRTVGSGMRPSSLHGPPQSGPITPYTNGTEPDRHAKPRRPGSRPYQPPVATMIAGIIAKRMAHIYGIRPGPI